MCECKINDWVLGVLLLVSLVAFLPVWPYSVDGDYAQSGRVAVVLAVFVVMKMTGRV